MKTINQRIADSVNAEHGWIEPIPPKHGEGKARKRGTNSHVTASLVRSVRLNPSNHPIDSEILVAAKRIARRRPNKRPHYC